MAGGSLASPCRQSLCGLWIEAGSRTSSPAIWTGERKDEKPATVQEGRGAEGPTEPGREGRPAQPECSELPVAWACQESFAPTRQMVPGHPGSRLSPSPGTVQGAGARKGAQGSVRQAGPGLRMGPSPPVGSQTPDSAALPAQLLPSEPRVHERPAQAAGGSKGPAELSRLPTGLP